MGGLRRSPPHSRAPMSWHLSFHHALHTSRSLSSTCLCSAIPPPLWHLRSFLTWTLPTSPESYLAIPSTCAVLLCLQNSDKSSFRDFLTLYKILSISDPKTLNSNSILNHGDDPKHPHTFPNVLWEWILLMLIENHWQSSFLNTCYNSLPKVVLAQVFIYRVVHVKFSINIC